MCNNTNHTWKINNIWKIICDRLDFKTVNEIQTWDIQHWIFYFKFLVVLAFSIIFGPKSSSISHILGGLSIKSWNYGVLVILVWSRFMIRPYTKYIIVSCALIWLEVWILTRTHEPFSMGKKSKVCLRLNN